MIELHFFLKRQSRINADFFPYHTIRCADICISGDKGKTITAVLIQLCHPFPFFCFPLNAPLPELLLFSLFYPVKLLLCIIYSKLLQIFSGIHGIHMKAFSVTLVYLFWRRASFRSAFVSSFFFSIYGISRIFCL